MSMNNGMGGFPGAPGGFPGAPGGMMGGPAAAMPMNGPAAGVGFTLDIPADPSWQPFDSTDTLDMDGYYACRVTRESPRTDSSKSRGLFITLEIIDEDQRGKVISKFLPDPQAAKGDVLWIWRSLIRSMAGSTEAAQQGFSYRPNVFIGRTVYVKTEPYVDGTNTRTSVAGFITQDEYEASVKSGKHRWPSKPKTPAGTPVGIPGAFPAMGAFPGAVGGPMTGPSPFGGAPAPGGAPMQGTPPQQQAAPPQQQAAPIQAAPPQQQAAPPAPFAAPPQAAPFAAPPQAPAPGPMGPVNGGGFGFPGGPQVQAAPAPAPGGAPSPMGAGFPNVFPGQPGAR